MHAVTADTTKKRLCLVGVCFLDSALPAHHYSAVECSTVVYCMQSSMACGGDLLLHTARAQSDASLPNPFH